MDEENMNVSSQPSQGSGDQPDAKGKLGFFGGGSVPPPPQPPAMPTMSAADFAAESYNMNHPRRGTAIIFNNKRFHSSTGMGERTGTDVDSLNLYNLFTAMGFKTEVLNDLKAHEMESTLVKHAKQDHTDADCFACAILSHGEEGFVYGTDGPIQIDKLVAPLKGHRCRTLAGKPKIFFIQACRGTQLDSGVEVADAKGEEEMDSDEVEIRRIPTEADFLMAYSVVPGFYAWRNSTRGSWFVQALHDVFRDNWQRMDLLTMMTRVCKKVAYDFESNASKEFMNRKKQIPCITSMLTRDVYFTPKK